MFFFKKGQMSMEMLMIYGIILIVIASAIGALSHYGILNPAGLLPNKCSISAGLECASHKVAADGSWIIILRNSMGQDLTAVDIDLEDGAGTCTPASLINGGDATCTGTVAAATIGAKLRNKITVKYTDEAGISHSIVGSLVTKYE